MRVLSLFIGLALFAGAALPARAQVVTSDDRIHDDVMRRLAGDRDVKGGGIEVNVADGVVTLRGKVREEKQKDRAERITKKVKGVKQVVNELHVEATAASSAAPADPGRTDPAQRG
jgi:hyperosmotically inducible periplasmic protein